MATIRLRKGSGAPASLNVGEPAFDYTNNALYIGATGAGGVKWVGAEVDNNTALGTSQIKIPTQYAVKTYVDASVGSGVVSSVNGLTGALNIYAGTALSVASNGKGITLTNEGVRSLSAGSFTNLSGTTGAVTINNAGVWTFNGSTGTVSGVGAVAAGTGISVSGATGASITIGNQGVLSLTPGSFMNISGTTGALTINNAGVHSINGSTGAITNVPFTNTANTFTVGNSFTGGLTASDLTVTNAATVGGNLSVTGNLTVNGTTTYVNSTVTEIADPIITLGWTGGVGGMPTDDNKDRGIAFKYNSTGGKTGFFGYDDSTGYFTFVPNATITGEVVSGSLGTIQIGTVLGSNTGNSLNLVASPAITSVDDMLTISGSTRNSRLVLQETVSGFTGAIIAASFTGTRTATLPDHSGTLVVPANLGTLDFILKSNGTTSQPTWINPNAAGFTAFMATNVAGGAAGSLVYQSAANTSALLPLGTANFILLAGSTGPQWSNATAITAGTAQTVTVASDVADTTCFVTFINTASDSNQAIKYNSSLAYNASTNYLEANIDGGLY